MIQKITENVFKIKNDSNIYYIKDKKLLIDTGDRKHLQKIKQDIKELFNPDDIQTIIFTHLNYDHVGCSDLFPNAKFYAHSEELKAYNSNPYTVILDLNTVEMLRKIKILPLPEIEELEYIHTPGHSQGSICILYNNILFSGDTKFKNGFGRVDLPTSNPHKMNESLEKLKDIKYEILCPGHDY